MPSASARQYICNTGSLGCTPRYEVIDTRSTRRMGGYCDRIDITIHFDN
jgi:DNA gyrase/topoisomerase IV subunit B